ncbi:MAG TPA: MFS transporter [Bacteroidales bacterium]|nr:MFS transporter [Bacteroidales bacterium]
MFTSSKSGRSGSGTYVMATAFLSLFAIVGFALYGLPFFYDFWEKDFGWSRGFITSGNALSKIVVAPLFGYIAGWIIDRYGPRKMLLAGSVIAGAALIGLGFMSSVFMFYFFYFLNAAGYVFGGPLPCQVLISRRFEKNRGRAMGIAYLGIGAGGVIVPHLSAALVSHSGWHTALVSLGVLMILIALPLAFFIKETAPGVQPEGANSSDEKLRNILSDRNFYSLLSAACVQLLQSVEQTSILNCTCAI